MDTLEGKQIVLDAGNRLLAQGLVAGTWGNISLKITPNHMVVTPSGKNYEDLTIDDMVVMDIYNYRYEGSIKPSSEAKLHAALYQERSDIGAIIHTHSLYASTVASARRKVPLAEPASEIIGDFIPITNYAISSTKSLLKTVVKSIGDKNAVLLANHGAFCVGTDMDNAFYICSLLESTCKDFIDNGGATRRDLVE